MPLSFVNNCFANYNMLVKCGIMCAVNHGGDSDSTGAVAGNIIGAIIGYDMIPKKFTETLQFRDLILSYSDVLSVCNK